MAPQICGMAEFVPVDEPGDLGRQLVALVRGGCDFHGEAAVDQARDIAFDTADMIEVGDDALALLDIDRGDDRRAADGNIE